MNNFTGSHKSEMNIRIFIRYIIGFALLSNGFCLQIFSQELSEKIKDFNKKNFKEELYIQTDRDIYITGEQVWFKVYKMNGLTNSPNNISKVVYLELLDKNNFPLKQLKIKTEGNSGSSSFTLPEKMTSGNYLIRAYTNWMQNWPADLFCYKYISVINPFENIDHIKLPSNISAIDSVAFFPEGGSLIPGTSNKVLIRSFDRDKKPVSIQGFIVNSAGDTLGHVKTEDNGYGTTVLKPSGNDKLFLSCTDNNGIRKKISLPDAGQSKFSLNVGNRNDTSPFTVRILKNAGVSLSDAGLRLVIYSGGIIPYSKDIIQNSDSVITILRTEFPDGLSAFLLIDREGNQLASRSVYKGRDQQIFYKIALNKPEYSSREQVKIEISATDKSGNPVETDLSASVAKSCVVNAGEGHPIDGFRLYGTTTDNMTGKKAGEINDYLISVNNNQLNWKNVTNPEETKYLPEIEGHLISGVIRYKDSDEPVNDTEISLSYVGKTARCQFTRTDKNGEFNFVVKESGSDEIVIQPLSSEITRYYIDLKQPFNSSFSRLKRPLFNLDSSKIGEINNAIISMQINSIYEPYRQKKEAASKPVIPDFYGKPENTIRMADYIELTSLREVVKEIIPNVYTLKQNGKYDFKLINKFRGQPFENKPLILVDGVPIYDFEKVLNISSKEIERADIINMRYFFSENIFDGIVSFITRKGNLSALEFDNSIFRQVYEACQLPKDFYSPEYTTLPLKESRIPDYRNTLYWKPDLHTGKNGKTEVEFFTSDDPAEYTIIIEGISPDGKTGFSSISFKVK
jgi:hypothetical protein